MQGITHLKQLSQMGVHLWQLSSHNNLPEQKMQKEIHNFENLALNMDLELHVKQLSLQEQADKNSNNQQQSSS